MFGTYLWWLAYKYVDAYTFRLNNPWILGGYIFYKLWKFFESEIVLKKSILISLKFFHERNKYYIQYFQCRKSVYFPDKKLFRFSELIWDLE